MAEYLANAAQNVALNAPVLFTASIPCTKGYVYHEDETGIFILRGCTNNCFARYQVTFDRRGRGTNARRDSMGRYSSDNRETIDKLYTLMERIPDLPSREVIKQIIKDMER